MNQDENLETNGEITETPTGSQPETTTAGGEGVTVNPQGAGTQTPEEATWNSLSGPSQDRFRQMARKLNEALSTREQPRIATPTPTVTSSNLQPDEQQAIRQLDEKYGIATKDFVGKQVDEKISQSLGGLVYQMELDRLEDRFDGANGLPAFSKDEYEAFVNTHPQYRGYQPEDVYEKMFPTEIMQFRMGQLGRQPVQRQNSSLKPTRTQVREEQWTPEAVEARLQEADGPEWYEKNLTLVKAVMSKTQE